MEVSVLYRTGNIASIAIFAKIYFVKHLAVNVSHGEEGKGTQKVYDHN